MSTIFRWVTSKSLFKALVKIKWLIETFENSEQQACFSMCLWNWWQIFQGFSYDQQSRQPINQLVFYQPCYPSIQLSRALYLHKMKVKFADDNVIVEMRCFVVIVYSYFIGDSFGSFLDGVIVVDDLWTN